VPLGTVASSGSGDGLSVQAGGLSPTAVDAGVPSGGQAPAGGTTGVTTPGTTSAVRPGATAAAGAPSATARLTTPVRVGLLYLEGVDTAASALGISGLSTGDTVAQAKAIVGYLNKHGGLAGRQIDLRLARIPASEAGSETAYAAACSSLAEDEHVTHVVSYLGLNENKLACYAKHGITVLDDQSLLVDRVGAKYASTFAAPGELAPGRTAGELVDALWRMGWLTSASKVGSLVYDTPEGIEIETRYLAAALAKHGLRIAVNARSSTQADGANQSGTVVKFRSAGVDRVIPLGASPLFLMQAAQTQGYHPLYALTSGFGPGALLESAAPPEQLKGAKGIGWSKYLDIGAGKQPGPVSGNETLCFEIMAAGGQRTSSATVKAFQVALCNVLMFLRAGAEAHGVTPSLLTTLRSQRFAFPAADAFSIRMLPGRPDGAAAYRDLAFDGGCRCFQYTSGNRATA
jgi:hypothetical protein